MVAVNNLNPRFPLGEVVATPSALSALESAGQTVIELLQRHVQLDQGELDVEDHELNQQAVTNGERILSSYLLKDRTKIWVITEADRSSTCLLLPEEY